MPSSVKIVLAVAMVAAVVSLTGCAPARERQLIGTWKLDAGDTGFGLVDKANIQLIFTDDGKLTVSSEAPIVGEMSRTGTWKYISEEENNVNIAYQWQKDDRPSVMVITIVDADTIRLIPPLGPVKAEVPFKRVVAKRS